MSERPMPGRIIALTGGIGAGKSVVARLLRTLGVDVYDCDLEARRLMDSSAETKAGLAEAFGEHVIGADGTINRPALAAEVFGRPERLARLNALVHPAVRRHLECWLHQRAAQPVAAFETAILRESGLAGVATEVWHVEAPAELRIERAMARSGLTEAQARSRVEAQHNEPMPGARVIDNDGRRPLIPQVLALLDNPA